MWNGNRIREFVLEIGLGGESTQPLSGKWGQFVLQFSQFIGKTDIPGPIKVTFFLYLSQQGHCRRDQAPG